jgi:hypothetical protein
LEHDARILAPTHRLHVSVVHARDVLAGIIVEGCLEKDVPELRACPAGGEDGDDRGPRVGEWGRAGVREVGERGDRL